MKKIFFTLLVLIFSFSNTYWNYENLNNINISIKGNNISWILLFEKLDSGLNKKYLDPVDKMNLSNSIINKLTTIDWKTSDDLELIFQELWNKYSKQVLENKRNTQLLILEGWNIFDIDTYLQQRSLIKKWEYINYVENSEKILALSEFFPFLDKQETLEGYLYPDTYKINPIAFKINNFVILQLNTFEEKVYNKLFIDEVTKKQLYPNSIIESVINLASIVEREEKNKSEQKIVAWILKKRLKEFRHIWADITVCYNYRLTSKQCRLSVSKYIKIKTPYNTRTTLGLPSTPINNPSFTTIDNTLNSSNSEFYYYLHDSNWAIHYGKNYDEHKENIKNYLK